MPIFTPEMIERYLATFCRDEPDWIRRIVIQRQVSESVTEGGRLAVPVPRRSRDRDGHTTFVYAPQPLLAPGTPLVLSEPTDIQMHTSTPSQDALDRVRDNSTGQYLCETCFDAMTDLVIPGSDTATGLDEARCVACQAGVTATQTTPPCDCLLCRTPRGAPFAAPYCACRQCASGQSVPHTDDTYAARSQRARDAYDY